MVVEDRRSSIYYFDEGVYYKTGLREDVGGGSVGAQLTSFSGVLTQTFAIS